jgi:hypothetical protein
MRRVLTIKVIDDNGVISAEAGINPPISFEESWACEYRPAIEQYGRWILTCLQDRCGIPVERIRIVEDEK